MKGFKGRIVASGTVTAKALVSHGGLNTLASFQKALQFGDKKATCGDQNNPDLYGKQMVQIPCHGYEWLRPHLLACPFCPLLPA